jgi:hypothetical protein
MIINGNQVNFFDLFNFVGKTSYDKIVEDISFTSPQNQYANFEQFFKNGIIFKQYESFEDAYNEIQSIIKNPLNESERRAKNVFEDLDKYKDYESFVQYLESSSPASSDVKEITEDLLSNVNEIINLGGNFKKSRIIITDDSRGIFDFSLASQGLFRPIEFFSQEYKEQVEKIGENEFGYLGEPAGVIPPQRVYKTKDSVGGYVYYFTSLSNKTFTCVRRQKGTTSVFENLNKFCFLKTNEQGIELPYSLDEPNKVYNGVKPYRLKYSSSTKKAYLKFEKQSDTTKFVDFFVPINFTYANDANRILNILPVILAASTLESFSIKVRINALRTGEVEGSIYETISMPVKEYDESTTERINFILNVFANMTFARKFFGALLIYNANKGEQKYEGKSIISKQMGPALNPLYHLRNAAPEIFNRYKNWARENKDQKFYNSKVVNENFQIFTTQFLESESEVNFFPTKAATDSSVIAANLPYALFLFYQYMDFLAIEFNETPKFVTEILKRIQEDKAFRKVFNVSSDDRAVRETLRKYILDILVLKYKPIENYAFADSPERIAEKNKKKEELIALIDSTLRTK